MRKVKVMYYNWKRIHILSPSYHPTDDHHHYMIFILMMKSFSLSGGEALLDRDDQSPFWYHSPFKRGGRAGGCGGVERNKALLLVLIIGQRYYKSLGLNTSTRCNIDCTLIKYLVQYLCRKLISLPNQVKWIRDGKGWCGVRVRNTDTIFCTKSG